MSQLLSVTVHQHHPDGCAAAQQSFALPTLFSGPGNGTRASLPASRISAKVPSSDRRCQDRMDVAGRSPGGRPLRRRREKVPIHGRQRLRGTAALQTRRMLRRCTVARPMTSQVFFRIPTVIIRWFAF